MSQDGTALAALLPAVNAIHGGCEVCAKHWVENANAALEQTGAPWRYERPVVDMNGQPIDKPVVVLVAAPVPEQVKPKWETPSDESVEAILGGPQAAMDHYADLPPVVTAKRARKTGASEKPAP
jgi:hypothetical protein